MTDPITRLNAALEGRYRIEAELGEGGMATVYLADDLRHERRVALKVLKPELAAQLGADRFVQEIKTTANLQHPNILALFDSGEAAGFLYYVMPYIAGESLRQKLDRETQLGIEEAVRITTQLADALEYAHAQDVIHRDIKPENILLHVGRPVLADFGIALALSAAAGARMTETGLSLGTPHYMSPEQATADKELTNRSDVYSLAAVLYEMLTGDPPHTGSSAQQIVMKILTEPAQPVSTARKLVPSNVAATLSKALEKLPADRFRTAAEFSNALNDPSYTNASLGGTADAGTLVPPWNPLSKALAGISLGLLAVLIWMLARPPGQPVLSTYDVGLPDSVPMVTDYLTGVSVSPQGDFVVYVARGSSATELWYRSLVDAEARPLPGTEGAWLPAISPGGDQVAFLTRDGAAKVMPIGGGSTVTLQQLDTPIGLQWTSATSLLLGDGDGSRVHHVGANGDDLTTADIWYCINPQQLPEPSLILCGGGGHQYAYVNDLSDGSTQYLRIPGTVITDSASYLRGAQFRVIEDRYLVFMSVDGELRATFFDPQTYEVGRSVTMMSGVRREAYTGAGQFGIGANGTLVYAPGDNASDGLLVKALDGVTRPLGVGAEYFLRYDISPDGRRLAAVVEGVREQELRVYDLTSSPVRSRVWLSDPNIGEPLWTADGVRLLVTVADYGNERWSTLIGSPDATVPPDTIVRSAPGDIYPPEFFDYQSDDKVFGAAYGSGLVVQIDLASEPVVLDTLGTGRVFATLSPDASWVAYQPVQLGEIFISPYPELDRELLVASSGSSGNVIAEPQWLSANELIYWECCATWYRMQRRPSSVDPVGPIEEWHSDPRFSGTPGRSYTLTSDGGLVYVQAPERMPVTYLRVIPNWVEQMKRAVDEANR